MGVYYSSSIVYGYHVEDEIEFVKKFLKMPPGYNEWHEYHADYGRDLLEVACLAIDLGYFSAGSAYGGLTPIVVGIGRVQHDYGFKEIHIGEDEKKQVENLGEQFDLGEPKWYIGLYQF